MIDTYDRKVQLGASRRRYEDALVLHHAGRCNGAIYLGGYAIECSLKSLICYNEGKSNLKETKLFRGGTQGAALHNLQTLLESAHLADLLSAAHVKKEMLLDRTGSLRKACRTVVELWEKDGLRYGNNVGTKSESERFMAAVKELHLFLLRKQGQAS